MEQRVGESGSEFVKRLKKRKEDLVYWADKVPAIVHYEMIQEIRQINSQLEVMEALLGGNNDAKEC